MTDFLKMTFGTTGFEVYLTCLGLFLFILSIYKLIGFLKKTGKFDKNFISTMKWVAGFLIAITILQPLRTFSGIQGKFNEVAIYRAKFQTDWLIASGELIGAFIGLILATIIITYLIRLLLPVFGFIHKKTNEGLENETTKTSNTGEMKKPKESKFSESFREAYAEPLPRGSWFFTFLFTVPSFVFVVFPLLYETDLYYWAEGVGLEFPFLLFPSMFLGGLFGMGLAEFLQKRKNR